MSIDDEREALRRVSWMVEGPYEDIEYRLDRTGEIDAILAAGFRRTEVLAPRAEHGPDWSDWGADHPDEGPSCKCGFNGTPEECAASREPQGEPSDAQVEAAARALGNRHSLAWSYMSEMDRDWERGDARAALRAAGGVR